VRNIGGDLREASGHLLAISVTFRLEALWHPVITVFILATSLSKDKRSQKINFISCADVF
jgi:hypothetical protein